MQQALDQGRQEHQALLEKRALLLQRANWFAGQSLNIEYASRMAAHVEQLTGEKQMESDASEGVIEADWAEQADQTAGPSITVEVPTGVSKKTKRKEQAMETSEESESYEESDTSEQQSEESEQADEAMELDEAVHSDEEETGSGEAVGGSYEAMEVDDAAQGEEATESVKADNRGTGKKRPSKRRRLSQERTRAKMGRKATWTRFQAKMKAHRDRFQKQRARDPTKVGAGDHAGGEQGGGGGQASEGEGTEA
ncbi:hypothetical protein GE09DRAFT_1140618 [Coniochaeta sp. 2T2.1]|nr:hypothetical protein GE09DRAFT_1140618 [Coniochaeta sp. 2T2.1]